MTIQLERFDIAVSETDVHVYSLNVGDTCSSFLTIKNSAAGKFFALKLSVLVKGAGGGVPDENNI